MKVNERASSPTDEKMPTFNNVEKEQKKKSCIMS